MSDLDGGIVQEVRRMYKESDAIKGKAVSTLVYGVCWDETVRFIKTNEKYKDIDKNSSGFGNYATGEVIQTGSNEKYSLNNIYDMVGNMLEWTMESYGTSGRVY